MGSNHDFLLWAEDVPWKRVNTYGMLLLLNLRMALMEIRILVASMILTYVWTGVPDNPGKWDEEMTPFESVVIRPRNKKCIINIKSRTPKRTETGNEVR